MRFSIPFEITGVKIINAEDENEALRKFWRIAKEDLAIDGELASYDAKPIDPIPFPLVDRLLRKGTVQ